MNIYIYSDESGVFDHIHNDIFVFGGLMLFSKDEKDICSRKYLHAEQTIRQIEKKSPSKEMKACSISNSSKGKLMRSLNQYEKFGIVINQKAILERIFQSKKDKQRYLDYAFKIGVKRALERLIENEKIDVNQVERIYFYNDEHTTATNGCYELEESLRQEFKNGTYNASYNRFFPPLFPKMKDVIVKFCNSEKTTLVRAADIIANNVYYNACSGNEINEEKLNITLLP